MDLVSHRAFNLFIYPSQRAFSKNQPCVLTAALLYSSRRRESCKVASAKRKSRSHFNSKYVFSSVFQTDGVPQKSHPGDPENALLGGQEEFSGTVSPNLSGKIWCSMKHWPDISVWSSTRSGGCGVGLEVSPIFIDLLCCRLGSSNQMLTSLATKRKALSTYGETNCPNYSKDFFICATDLLICVHAAFMAG